MSTHSKDKASEEGPDFEKALGEFRTAWKNGKAAGEKAENAAKIKLLTKGRTVEAAQAIMALKTVKTGAGSDLAGNQKYRILRAAAPLLAESANKLIESAEHMALLPVPKRYWKPKRKQLQEQRDLLIQFDGYYKEPDFSSPISNACSLSELVLSCKHSPSYPRLTGLRARARISKLLNAAEGNKHKEEWATNYLVSSVNSTIGTEEKAEAIANILEASGQLKQSVQFMREFTSRISDMLIAPEQVRTPLASRVSIVLTNRARGKKQTMISAINAEFRESLRSLIGEQEDEDSLDSLLRSPEAWARRMEEGEELTLPKSSSAFLKTQPAPRLINAAIVVANADVHPEMRLPRGKIATKLLLAAGANLPSQEEGGKRQIMVEQNQEKLLSRIKEAMEQPAIRQQMEEFFLQSEDFEQKERLRSLFVMEQQESEDAAAERQVPYADEQEGQGEEQTAQEELPEPEEFNIPGMGTFPREEIDALELRQAASEAPGTTDKGEQQAEEEEEPFLDAPPQEITVDERALIFRKLEDALPLIEEIASDGVPLPDRTYVAEELANLLETPGESPWKLIHELHSLASSDNEEASGKAVAAMLSLPYVSEYNWSSRRNSSVLVSALAASLDSNPGSGEIDQKIISGFEQEADFAIDAIAQYLRTYTSLDIPADFPVEDAALLYLSRNRDPSSFARVALSLPGLGASKTKVMHCLEDAWKQDENSVYKVLLTALNDHRAQKPGSAFPSHSENEYSDSEAETAEDFFFWLGRGEEALREISIAAGVSEIYSPESAQFIVQRFSDADNEDEFAMWEAVLQEFEGPEADTMIVQAFDSLSPEKKEKAISILSARAPSLDNAEFLLSLCISPDKEIAGLSADALSKLDFSRIDEQREFMLLYRMRNHPSPSVVEVAGKKLPAFLAENQGILSKETAELLSSLDLNDPDPEIRGLAKEALLQNPAGQLEGQLTASGLIASLSKPEPTATLATYALAKEMQLDPDHLTEEVSTAAQDYSEDPLSMMRLMVAATASDSEKYAELVLVPQLGADDIFSKAASSFILRLGEKGLGIAARAAGRANLPEGISAELEKRISDKAIAMLCKKKEFSRLVPFLNSADPKIRSSVYRSLEGALESQEKDEALLDALSSSQRNIRLAALNLLSHKSEHREYVTELVDDIDEEVSLVSAKFVAPLFSTEELIGFLNTHESVFAKQRIADAYLKRFPDAVGEMAFLMEEAGNKLETVSALRFFREPRTLTCLYETQKNADEKENMAIRESVLYLCRSLAISEDPTQEQMLMLLIAQEAFGYENLRSNLKKEISHANASLMADAVIESKEPSLLLSATDFFLSASMEGLAVETAKRLRETGAVSHEELTETYQQVLFGGQADKMHMVASPVLDPSADPGPYRLVKEIAIDQMVNGNGSPESSGLFFLFADTFGDIEGFFDAGFKSVLELVWASREDEESRDYLASKIPSLVAEEISEDTKHLVSLLLLDEHGELPKMQESPNSGELKNIVVEHALRTLVEASVLFPDRLPVEKAESRLKLLAKLYSSGMVSEGQIDSIGEEGNPIALAIAGRPLAPEEAEKGKDALGLALIALKKESRRAVDEFRQMYNSEGTLPKPRFRADPPQRPEGSIEPKRPERRPSSPPTRK
ncbi:hypothetical protein GF412_02030 [Candidatus Micrarchaeota archaeon]|nr:hypothetical protein [Candidatus Micrarchaeota archaeon]MBD3417741.1 hypothetical protein [Candidatus Micrarchaeota archaeon]